MKLSVVIPAYNEMESLPETLGSLYAKLSAENIPHELLVVNDNSKDNTLTVLESLSKEINTLVYITNPGPNGFGMAVRYGMERFSGDCMALVMADLSDSPDDLVRFYRKMMEGNYDCVFGTRFSQGGKVYNYPKHKLILNRLVNNAVRITFGFPYNDFTNAFKLYKKETILGLRPYLSPHFNLTLELSLKALIRGYNFAVIPNSWTNRKYGKSNLKIKEMGSRYFFIFLYCLIEKFFSRGDFHKDR
ncbi:MAG: glycosyltransferase family 2 protein [Chitinophagaceae bacterium]|nr:glycosyltransferase family 2 protein [Chitinophagaceae bacterium]MCB9044699.1 glycosyltransferase family 2 protein [Chitinophagales bacterium]